MNVVKFMLPLDFYLVRSSRKSGLAIPFFVVAADVITK